MGAALWKQKVNNPSTVGSVQNKHIPAELHLAVVVCAHRTLAEAGARLHTDAVLARLPGKAVRGLGAEGLAAALDAQALVAGAVAGTGGQVNAGLVHQVTHQSYIMNRKLLDYWQNKKFPAFKISLFSHKNWFIDFKIVTGKQIYPYKGLKYWYAVNSANNDSV